MATSIDNLVNVAFINGQDLLGFGINVGGKGGHKPPQFDVESLRFEYINDNESYRLEFNQEKVLGFTFNDSHEFKRATTATFVGSSGIIQIAAIDEPRFTHDPETRELLGFLFGLDATLQNEVTETAKISNRLQYLNPEGGRYEISGQFSQGDPILFSAGNAMVRANSGGQQTVQTGYVNASFNKDVSLGIGITATINYIRGSGGALALNISEFLDLAIQELPNAI